MLDTVGHVQARTIEGVFMLGSAARKVTKTKSSLPALQELLSHQEPVGNKVKPTKNPGRWSTFAKFKEVSRKLRKPTATVIPLAGWKTQDQAKEYIPIQHT